MTPTGQGNLKQAIDLLEADSLEQGHPLCMLGVTPDAKEELEKAIPADFSTSPNGIISITSTCVKPGNPKREKIPGETQSYQQIQ